MPKTIHYNKVQDLISKPRIDTYVNFFQNHTTAEVYGVYLWNKVLCGAVYPLLQAAEVALRNTINKPAVNRFGDYWYEHIDHHYHNLASGIPNFNHSNLRENFDKARKNVVRKINKQRRSAGLTNLPLSHKPDFDVVVAATDFSTWEYALHSCHYKLNDTDFLWPKQSKKSFKNWPNQSSQITHTTIYDIVSELRPFRNRLSHHEPLWKGISVNTEQDALNYVNQKIDKIEQLLEIISADNTKLLDVQKLVKRARYMASKDMLDRCRYRAKGKQISFRKKKKVKQFLTELREHKEPKLVAIAGQNYLIEAI